MNKKTDKIIRRAIIIFLNVVLIYCVIALFVKVITLSPVSHKPITLEERLDRIERRQAAMFFKQERIREAMNYLSYDYVAGDPFAASKFHINPLCAECHWR